jgi:hypothetical protein
MGLILPRAQIEEAHLEFSVAYLNWSLPFRIWTGVYRSVSELEFTVPYLNWSLSFRIWTGVYRSVSMDYVWDAASSCEAEGCGGNQPTRGECKTHIPVEDTWLIKALHPAVRIWLAESYVSGELTGWIICFWGVDWLNHLFLVTDLRSWLAESSGSGNWPGELTGWIICFW